MPVNFTTPAPEQLFPVAGVRLGSTAAGIRKADRRDLTLIELSAGSHVAGVFTQNRFCAAPVQIAKKHLADGDIRALVINTGIANAGTGEAGLEAARQTCTAAAHLLDIGAAQVLPFSTGVIMEPLPADRIAAGLPQCLSALKADGWFDAAHAIMTTDTVAKAVSRRLSVDGKTVTLTGIAKGAGMIKPNMATMLGFLATDAAVEPALLNQLVKDVADASFNCVTVDGDTSTNDSFVMIATGRGEARFDSAAAPGWETFKTAAVEAARVLAQAIVRDGEGATKYIEIDVQGGRNREECRAVGYAIAHSPLVKTAFFASDPNLGRILAAIGNAAQLNPALADLDVDRVKLWLGEVLVSENGGRAASYREEAGAGAMAPAEIRVRVDLGRGEATAQVWTCDFSYDYVKINADYRS